MDGFYKQSTGQQAPTIYYQQQPGQQYMQQQGEGQYDEGQQYVMEDGGQLGAEYTQQGDMGVPYGYYPPPQQV